MKKFSILIVVIGLIGALCIQNSQAAEITLQNVFDNITVGPNPGVSSVTVGTDEIGYDAYWSITGSGISASTLIVEIAAWEDVSVFGVFDRTNPNKKAQLFAGIADSGDQATLSIKLDGSVFVNLVDTGIDFAGNAFGYYLDTPNGIFLSDTLLNPDGYDHMWAYQGKNIDTIQLPGSPAPAPGLWVSNEYALAFEDTYGGGDGDHQDFVAMVESVQPIVPEPGTLLLLGAGLVGLAGYSKFRISRRKK